MEKAGLGRTVSSNDHPSESKSKYITKFMSFRIRSQNNKDADLDSLTVFKTSEPDLEESSTDDLIVQICKDSIRQSLLDAMRSTSSDIKILLDIELGRTVQIGETTPGDKNILFLWACLNKKVDYLPLLYNMGAKLEYTVPGDGYAPIHLSAFSGDLKAVNWLVSQGCNINYTPKHYSPLHYAVLGNSPEVVKFLLSSGCKLGDTVLHTAVRANTLDCLNILLSKGADPNILDKSGMSPLHLAADKGATQCLLSLLDYPTIDINIETKEKHNTALHYSAEGGMTECVQILLKKGGDHSKRNKKWQTPLHLAAKAQSVECIEALVKVGADVNARDSDNRSPLHAAVGKVLNAYNTLDILVKSGANVNLKDKYGYSALHIAAINELAPCVDMLIMHGADLSSQTKGGLSALNLISRKTPVSLQTISSKLDTSLSINDPEHTNREVELKLDFRYLLQHSSGGEVGLLKTLVDEGQKNSLEHPLCSAFLYIKWQKIRRFYFSRLFLSTVFVLVLTLYVITALAHNNYNTAKDRDLNARNKTLQTVKNKTLISDTLSNNTSYNDSAIGENPPIFLQNVAFMESVWYVLVVLAIFEITRKVLGTAGYKSFTEYLIHWANISEWFTILSVFAVSFVYSGRIYGWQNVIGAFSVLCGWTNLMVMVGQLPVFGTYVEMFTRVQKEFGKLFLAYVFLLIGFSASFYILFPHSPHFDNPFTGFVKVLVLMTGELDFDLLVNESMNELPMKISAHIIFILFLIFVTIILMNLLVGIAVHDIQGLHKTAGLSKLVRQTELISFLELSLFQGYIPTKIVTLLRKSALITPAAYRVVLYVKPLNPREKRLPKEIMLEAYNIARSNRNCNTLYKKTCVENKELTMFKRVERIEKMLEQQQSMLDQINNILKK